MAGSGSQTYSGGTVVPPTTKGLSFTASYTETSTYEVTAIGLTGTLSSTDPVGTRYEVYDNTGNANPNFLFLPNGGKVITSSIAVGAASVTLTVQGFWRVVTKMSGGNWLMGGI